jgi:hypothetical protein
MIPFNIYLPYFMALVSLSILLLNRIQIGIGLLAFQYLLAFFLTLPVLSLRSIIARLVGGIVVSLILLTAERRFSRGLAFSVEITLPRSYWFRLITALIVLFVAWAFAYQYGGALTSLDANVFLAAVFNICMGFLMLGLYQSPLEAAVGMLTLLIGFDLFYGGIEPSLAIVALLISIQLIIGLATSYILSVAHHSTIGREGQ